MKNVFIKTEDCICCGGCLSVCPGWALMKIENECTTRNNGGGSGSGDSGGWDGGGGGGGSSAPVLSPVIKPLVGKHSLSPDQLRRLNDSVKELDGNCFFNALFKEFKRKGYTPFTDVKVDPTYLGNAGFRGDYVLRFGWDDAISTAGTVGEEFFHLFQLRGVYGQWFNNQP